MKKLALSMLLSSAMLSSLATAGMFDLSEKQVFDRTTFNNDNYTKVRSYISPLEIFKSPKYLETTEVEGYFKLEKSDSNENTCLFLRIRDRDWSFFQEAYDSEGNKLTLKEVDRKVGTYLGKASVTEVVCLDLTKEYLLSKMDQGLDIKLVGKRSSIIVKVRPQTLKGFQGAVEKIEEIKFPKDVDSTSAP